MQIRIRAILLQTFVVAIALTSSLLAIYLTTATYGMTTITVWAVGVVAIAAFALQTAVGRLALSFYVWRWLLDPRAAVEGLWIERVETPGYSGAVTFSLVSIEYNANSDEYSANIWNFDEQGRMLRQLKSSPIHFAGDAGSILYRYGGQRILRGPGDRNPAENGASWPPGAFAQECLGYCCIDFKMPRFGRYSYASGAFIDCSLKTRIQGGRLRLPASANTVRSVALRRIRKRELRKLLANQALTGDPRPRIRHLLTRRRARWPYKSHDLARIVMAFAIEAMHQDLDLAARGGRATETEL